MCKNSLKAEGLTEKCNCRSWNPLPQPIQVLDVLMGGLNLFVSTCSCCCWHTLKCYHYGGWEPLEVKIRHGSFALLACHYCRGFWLGAHFLIGQIEGSCLPFETSSSYFHVICQFGSGYAFLCVQCRKLSSSLQHVNKLNVACMFVGTTPIISCFCW